MFSMAWVSQCFEQLPISISAAGILGWAGTLAIQAYRVPSQEICSTKCLNLQEVIPFIPEIIDVEELGPYL